MVRYEERRYGPSVGRNLSALIAGIGTMVNHSEVAEDCASAAAPGVDPKRDPSTAGDDRSSASHEVTFACNHMKIGFRSVRRTAGSPDHAESTIAAGITPPTNQLRVHIRAPFRGDTGRKSINDATHHLHCKRAILPL